MAFQVTLRPTEEGADPSKVTIKSDTFDNKGNGFAEFYDIDSDGNKVKMHASFPQAMILGVVPVDE